MHRPLTFLTIALTLASCAAANKDPVTSNDGPIVEPIKTVFIDLPDGMMFPEGIAEGSEGSLYVSVFGSNAILQIDSGGSVNVFKQPGENGLMGPVGLVADLQRNRLWVASVNGETFMSKLFVFDLNTGATLATHEGPPAQGPHFFNEVVLASDGRVYLTDTLQPRIWTAGPELTDPLSVVIEDPRLTNPNPERPLGLNGFAFTPDGRYLIASVMDRITQGGGRLLRLDPASGELDPIEIDGDIDSFGGPDGMFFEPQNDRLVMVNATPPSSIVSASFNGDFTRATLTDHAYADSVANRPSSSALSGERLWIVNSQLDHVIDDGNGAVGTPPDLPFQIVGVDATATLAP